MRLYESANVPIPKCLGTQALKTKRTGKISCGDEKRDQFFINTIEIKIQPYCYNIVRQPCLHPNCFSHLTFKRHLRLTSIKNNPFFWKVSETQMLTYLYLFAPKKIKKWMLLFPWLLPASFANLSNYSRVGVVKLYNLDRARIDAYPFTFRPVLKGYSREYYFSENRTN